MNATLKISKAADELAIEFNNLPIATRQTKSGSWIAFCPMFRLHGFSKKSQDAAVEDFHESLAGVFQILLEENTLQDALDHFGWKAYVNLKHDPEPRPSFRYPTIMPQIPTRNFNIPVTA